MKVKDITKVLEDIAHSSLQEDYDNSGLQVGNPNAEVNAVLLTLDCTEEVLEEAKSKGCNLVIAHHPIIFKGLKSLTGKNYVERIVIKAIQEGIAIYAIHTNLDNAWRGVNWYFASLIGLKGLEILAPKRGLLSKLVVYTPSSHANEVRNSLFSAGAGNIGDYSECSFNSNGNGTFTPGDETNPFQGSAGVRETADETKIEVVVENFRLSKVLSSMNQAHPYEEVAYDVLPMKMAHPRIGAGMVGELDAEMEVEAFFDHIKKTFSVDKLKHTPIIKKKIKTVAVCGGSGSFLLNDAIRAKADVFITADFKYHQFFDADNSIVIADIGHFESEHRTIELFEAELTQKFPNFALHLSKVNTNPVKFY